MIRTKVAAALVAAALGWSGAALAQGTMDQRVACTPDVFRLCKSEIPNVSRIVACMEKQKQDLSPACRAVFKPPELAQR